MFATMTIGKKLYTAFGAALVLTLGLGVTAIWSVSSLSDELQKRLVTDAARITTAQNGVFAKQTKDSERTIALARWMCSLIGLLACVVGVAGFVIVRSINGVLRRSVTDLGEAAVQIAAAATQVASTSQNMARDASRQAATIEETSASSSEINSMAQRNTENSCATAEIVTETQERFEATSKSLSEMVDAMDGITASSQKISKIIKVIDEIAFQTNILALNAAVEAARAGEAGMGFAVVADEVRNLAQRCAQAAHDTAELIEDSITKSDGGKAKVDDVVDEIKTIMADSARMKVLMDEINVGSVEQAHGIDQIARAVIQMESVTQSSAANAEESAAAAEELSGQARTMQDIVSHLTVMLEGSSRPNATTYVAPSKTTLKMPRTRRMPSTSAKVMPTRSVVPFPATKKVALVSKMSGTDPFPMDDDVNFKEF